MKSTVARLAVLAIAFAVAGAVPAGSDRARTSGTPALVWEFNGSDEGWRALKSFDNPLFNIPELGDGFIYTDHKNRDGSLGDYLVWVAPQPQELMDYSVFFRGDVSFKLKSKPVDKRLNPQQTTVDILGEDEKGLQSWISATTKPPKKRKWTQYRIPWTYAADGSTASARGMTPQATRTSNERSEGSIPSGFVRAGRKPPKANPLWLPWAYSQRSRSL